jgi:DNA invertase Pin-like site-specific DNA recombinase
MRIVTCREEKTFHKRGFFLECKSMSFNSILGRPVPCRYIGNIRGPAPKLSAIRRQHKNRDDAIRAGYETGAYSYQQIAKEFGVHFTTVGRVVRQPR